MSLSILFKCMKVLGGGGPDWSPDSRWQISPKRSLSAVSFCLCSTLSGCLMVLTSRVNAHLITTLFPFSSILTERFSGTREDFVCNCISPPLAPDNPQRTCPRAPAQGAHSASSLRHQRCSSGSPGPSPTIGISGLGLGNQHVLFCS